MNRQYPVANMLPTPPSCQAALQAYSAHNHCLMNSSYYNVFIDSYLVLSLDFPMCFSQNLRWRRNTVTYRLHGHRNLNTVNSASSGDFYCPREY